MLFVDLICWLLFRKISLSDNPLPKVVEQWKRRFTSILPIQLRDPKDAVSKGTRNVYAIGWCRRPLAAEWRAVAVWGEVESMPFERMMLETLECVDLTYFLSVVTLPSSLHFTSHNQIKHTHIFIRVCASFAVWCCLFCTLHLIMFCCGTKALIPTLYSQSGFCVFWWGSYEVICSPHYIKI